MNDNYDWWRTNEDEHQPFIPPFDPRPDDIGEAREAIMVVIALLLLVVWVLAVVHSQLKETPSSVQLVYRFVDLFQ